MAAPKARNSGITVTPSLIITGRGNKSLLKKARQPTGDQSHSLLNAGPKMAAIKISSLPRGKS